MADMASGFQGIDLNAKGSTCSAIRWVFSNHIPPLVLVEPSPSDQLLISVPSLFHVKLKPQALKG